MMDLTATARELLGRIRADDPAATAAWLASLPPTRLRHVALALSVLVPQDQPVEDLLAWWTTPASPRPTAGQIERRRATLMTALAPRRAA